METMKCLRRPASLKPGDFIAVITPGAPVRTEFIEGACQEIHRRGFNAKIMPHALAEPHGIYASTAENRLADFIDAWKDPSVKVILCSRGGYGSVQISKSIYDFIVSNPELPPKWVIGFSDITVFHCLLSRLGIQSIHGPMAKNITCTPGPDIDALFDILEGNTMQTLLSTGHPLNFPGEAEGLVCGGNFATFNGLGDTPFDPLLDVDTTPKILFLEDIGENIYEINRMLWRLHLSGKLSALKGLIFGQFTDYKPDRNFSTMEEMIYDTLRQFNVEVPVIFDFPAGHVDHNSPIVMGSYIKMCAKLSL